MPAIISSSIQSRELESSFIEQYPNLVRFASLLTNSTYDAEELVQDAYMKIARRGSSEVENAIGYFRQTISNLAKNRWRTLSAYRRAIARLDPATDVEMRELVDSDALVLSIRRLPIRQRQAVALRFFFDLSHEQIANEMGITVGAAKSAVSRGVDALAALMDGESNE